MLEGLRFGVRFARGLAFAGRRSKRTLAYQLQLHAHSARGEHPFLLFGGERFSYRQANAIANRYAHAYKALGVGRGDVVALMLDNRPEFLWHFLGVGKLGAVASLINTHNTGHPLLHTLTICEPKLIVIGSEHADAFGEVRAELGAGVQVFIDEDPASPAPARDATLPPWSKALEGASDQDPQEAGQHALADLAAYIYTSGTTGLPKAALVRQQRLYGLGLIFGTQAFRLTERDVVYNCLPLYHSNAIGVGTASVIMQCATLALARKFSARNFWDEVRQHRATSFVYIGELCRYLMNQPERPDDREHQVRVIVGNGLRPDIWPGFKQRFGIEHIREFYGSTEGNVGSLNLDDSEGSVGRLFGGVLAKWDEEREDFARSPEGFLVRSKPGEPGVLLGRIRGGGFDGYQDKKETERKIVRNAWKQGDAWFNTGDLLRTDGKRRLYFVDRIGDTFRWKGENVSTFEVQEQIASYPAAEIVNVYGVLVPGTEGRAGMAAMLIRGEFDPADFQRHVDHELPAYARPLFLRLLQKVEVTSTFKYKKAALRSEGFDPSKVSDPLYLRHPERDRYEPLTPELFAALQARKLRF